MKGRDHIGCQEPRAANCHQRVTQSKQLMDWGLTKHCRLDHSRHQWVDDRLENSLTYAVPLSKIVTLRAENGLVGYVLVSWPHQNHPMSRIQKSWWWTSRHYNENVLKYYNPREVAECYSICQCKCRVLMSACGHPGVPEDCHGRHHNQTATVKIIDRRSVNEEDMKKYLGWKTIRCMRITESIDLVESLETWRTRARWLNICAWESRKMVILSIYFRSQKVSQARTRRHAMMLKKRLEHSEISQHNSRQGSW